MSPSNAEKTKIAPIGRSEGENAEACARSGPLCLLRVSSEALVKRVEHFVASRVVVATEPRGRERQLVHSTPARHTEGNVSHPCGGQPRRPARDDRHTQFSRDEIANRLLLLSKLRDAGL
jgi:hypothetical protein